MEGREERSCAAARLALAPRTRSARARRTASLIRFGVRSVEVRVDDARQGREELVVCEDAARTDSASMASSVVVLDRGNNTTCTVNLHGECTSLRCGVARLDCWLAGLLTCQLIVGGERPCGLPVGAVLITATHSDRLAGATVVSWRVNNQEQLFVR